MLSFSNEEVGDIIATVIIMTIINDKNEEKQAVKVVSFIIFDSYVNFRPQGCKTFFVLNLAEHDLSCSPMLKCQHDKTFI